MAIPRVVDAILGADLLVLLFDLRDLLLVRWVVRVVRCVLGMLVLINCGLARLLMVILMSLRVRGLVHTVGIMLMCEVEVLTLVMLGLTVLTLVLFRARLKTRAMLTRLIIRPFKCEAVTRPSLKAPCIGGMLVTSLCVVPIRNPRPAEWVWVLWAS